MNTLDDLRSTLRREAEFDDAERTARPLAVRARVRSVRRRRVGAVSVTAALTLLAAVALVSALRDPGTVEPAGPRLADVDVPAQIYVLGAPYRLVDTQHPADDGDVQLGDASAVVTLVATGLGSGQATLWSGFWPVARVRGGEQLSAPVPVGGDLRIELEGAPDGARAELAIYGPTGDPAPGVELDGAVFVERYGDRELVDAQFATGDEDVTVGVPDGSGDLDVSAYCRSETAHLWLHRVGTGGATPCAALAAVEADQLLGPQPGEQTVAAYVTEGRNGPRATGVDVTFGIALYRQSVAPTRVLGQDAATVVDHNGRTWRLDEVLEGSTDGEYAVNTSGGDVFIAAAYANAVSGFVSWRGAPEGGWSGLRGGDEPESGLMEVGVLLAGEDTVQLHLTGPDAEGRLLVYRPV